MKICIYCNKETQSDIMVKSSKKDNAKEYPCCSEECFKKAERFFKYSSIAMWIFIPIIILYLSITVLALMRIIPTFYTSVVGIIFGLCYIVFPFGSRIDASYQCIKSNEFWMRMVGIVLASMYIIPELITMFTRTFMY